MPEAVSRLSGLRASRAALEADVGSATRAIEQAVDNGGRAVSELLKAVATVQEMTAEEAEAARNTEEEREETARTESSSGQTPQNSSAFRSLQWETSRVIPRS